MMAQSQSQVVSGKVIPSMPQGINEYLYQINKMMGKRTSELENYEDMATMYGKMMRFAGRSEADHIVNLHKNVYQNQYPYHEMLDPTHIGNFVGDPKNGFCALFGCTEMPVAGCGIMAVDSEKHTGYLRGLMILPEYQGKVDIKTGVMAGAAFGYARYKDVAQKWYTETRTAHPKAQYLMEAIGLRPCGIFPNKDVFFGGTKRESDVLEVSYFDDTLFVLRNPSPVLVPQLADLFEYTSQRFLLQSDITYEESSIPLDDMFLMNAWIESRSVEVSKTVGEFNTVNYKIATKSGSWMTFMVTNTVSAAERTEMHIESPEDLTAILIRLKQVVIADHLEYFEIFLPATDATQQAIFLELDFSVFGYVPAWKENKQDQDGLLDDCIVFGLFTTPIDDAEIKLTAYGGDFLKMLAPYLRCGVN